jgi:hypothetical protein
MAAKKRKMSAAQKAALAKGRAKLAAKKKSVKPKKTTQKRKVKAKAKSVKRQPKTGTKVAIMAKRRKKTRSSSSFGKKAKRTYSRAKRALGKYSGTMAVVKDAAIAVGGGLAAGVLANKLPISDPRIKAAAPIAAGIALAATLGRKNKMAQGFATGMVVLGAVAMLKQLAPNVPMLAGEEEMMYVPQIPYSPSMEGEMVNLGQDSGELAYMGENVELGDDYVSPASM